MKSEKRKVVGIIGDPIEHTLSPAMHNAAFKHLKLPYVYKKFQVKPEKLRGFIEGIKRDGSMVGVNVTLPHKEAARGLCNIVDPEAQEVVHLTGAVNVLCFRQGEVSGYNTDVYGFSKCLEESGIVLDGKRIVVVGAGGAARACISVCARSNPKNISIFNRTLQNAIVVETHIKEWFQSVAIDAFELTENSVRRYMRNVDVLIQTTSVGMHPHIDASPIPEEIFPHVDVAIDIIYRPSKTCFLRYAEQKGSKIILNGIPMLLHQGAKAFEIWTGKKAPLDVMRRALHQQMK